VKIGDVLILSLALAMIVIGVHQSLTVGIGGSYAIFMFAVGLLFWFQLRRNKAHAVEKKPPVSPRKKKKN
jgi:Flp pilus assembly protein protease CpaA